MKLRFESFLGSIALSLLAGQVFAVQVTSASTQTGRVEGQTATVSATVEWETAPISPVNPLERRFVTATVLNNGLAGVTAVPLEKSIYLTLNSSGVYQGTFTNLPAGSYTIQIAATRKITDGVPAFTTIISDSENRGLSIGFPAGCFTFPNHDLQGFTAKGFFDGDTSNFLVNQTFNPLWDPIGFGSTEGSFSLVLAGTQPPLASQTSGFFRWDVISPDLSKNPQWQGITGVSYRFRAGIGGSGAQLHAVARIKDAAGNSAVFTQFDGTGKPILAQALGENFQTMIDRFTLPANSMVVGVDIRAFARPGGSTLPNFLYDSICPLH